MQESPTPFNWTALNVAVVILSTVVGIATAYLRMFINGKMSELEKSIMTQIEVKFPQKEYIAMQINAHERRLQRIETRMENIRVKKAFDDDNIVE